MTWMGRLCPYLKSTGVFVDRASGRTDQDWHRSGDLLANYAYPPTRRAAGMVGQRTYAPPFGTAMWEGLGGYSGLPLGGYQEEVPSCLQSQVARPTETVLVCDHRVFDWGTSVRKIYFPAPRHHREPDRQLPNGSSVPQGLINVAFVDGHVKALKHERLWAIRRGYSQMGRDSSDVFVNFWPYE